MLLVRLLRRTEEGFYATVEVQRAAERLYSPSGRRRDFGRGGAPQSEGEHPDLLMVAQNYGGLIPSEMKRLRLLLIRSRKAWQDYRQESSGGSPLRESNR